jgi:hypothetical protein
VPGPPIDFFLRKLIILTKLIILDYTGRVPNDLRANLFVWANCFLMFFLKSFTTVCIINICLDLIIKNIDIISIDRYLKW